MEKNIKKIHCPQCASQKVKYLDDNVFECSNCQSSFFIETNQTTVNHKHTYKNEPFVKTNYEQKRKMIYLISGIIIFALIFFIPTFLQKKSNNNSVNATTEEVTLGAYKFDRPISFAFLDETNSLKIFIIGTVEAINYNDEKYKSNVFWAVYDVLKGSFDQITPFSVQGKEVIERFPDLEIFKFPDGNLYFVYNDLQLFKYDVVSKNISELNDEVISNVIELQSGISHIGKVNGFHAFFIRSNTGKEVNYYPISKVYNTDNFRYTLKKYNYPNDKPTVFFANTDNEPSFLVKYNAMYSMGYPFCYNPSISSTIDENENFVSASFGDYWITASRLIDYEVLNTDNKVYKMNIIDYRDNLVAFGIKTSNNVNLPYILQLQDYDGNLLWSINTNENSLEKNNGAVSKQYGVLAAFSSDSYKHYTIQGELNKDVKIEELTFNLD